MADNKQHDTRTTRRPDCVTEIRMGGVLRVVQVVQRKVGRDDQRLAAAVTAVNHIENLFQPVLGAALHAEVVKDKQRITSSTTPAPPAAPTA